METIKVRHGAAIRIDLVLLENLSGSYRSTVADATPISEGTVPPS